MTSALNLSMKLIQKIFQVQIQKLDRASRLLLGALIEAHDILQQLQAECENPEENVVDTSVRENIERVRHFTQVISVPKNELTSTADNQATPIQDNDIVPDENKDIDNKASDTQEDAIVAPTPVFVKDAREY